MATQEEYLDAIRQLSEHSPTRILSSTMATQEEHLDAVRQLPEPYRTRVIDNLRSLPRFQEISSPVNVTDVIMNGFSWTHTPEGRVFWNVIYLMLSCESPLPPPVSLSTLWPAKQ